MCDGTDSHKLQRIRNGCTTLAAVALDRGAIHDYARHCTKRYTRMSRIDCGCSIQRCVASAGMSVGANECVIPLTHTSYN